MDDMNLLKEIKKLLSTEFGNEIQKVILYGSRSKGTSGSDSDYDILVILKNPYDWRMRKKISSVCYDIDLKYDVLTDVKTISVNELESAVGKQPFIMDAVREGIAVTISLNEQKKGGSMKGARRKRLHDSGFMY